MLHVYYVYKYNNTDTPVAMRYQWRFYVGVGCAIASPVFSFSPPVWRDATIIVTTNNITVLRCVDRKRLKIRNLLAP